MRARNVLGYAVPELFWGFAWAFTLDAPMISAFAEQSGAADDYVGTIWLLVGLGLAAPMLLAPWVTRSVRRKRTLVLWGHVAGGVLLLGMAWGLHACAGYGESVRRSVYAVGVLAFFLSIGFLVPPWLSLVGDLFAERARSRVLGVTFVFNRVGGFAGGAVARQALERYADPWVGLFALAGVLMIVGSLPYLWIHENERTPRRRGPFGAYVTGLAKVLRENRPLRTFVAYDLIGLAYYVLLAHFATAGFGAGIPESTAGTWTQLGALGILLAAALVAWRGHTLRPRRWLALSMFVAAAGAALAAWGGAPWTYGAAAFAGGVCLGTRMTCHAPEVMLLVRGDATEALGVAGTMATLVQGLLPFIAGFVLLGVSYAPVFGIVALCTVVAGVLFLRPAPRAGVDAVAAS